MDSPLTPTGERHAMIAGALFDFLGYLTTRPEPLTLGSEHEAPPAVDALQAWASERGLSLEHADVHRWQQRLPG